jgi:hypothetical protein
MIHVEHIELAELDRKDVDSSNNLLEQCLTGVRERDFCQDCWSRPAFYFVCDAT